MASQQLIHFFRSSNLVSLKAAEEIAETFSPKSVKKSEFLFKEGRVCNDYYFLESGFIRAFAYNTEGNDVTTNFYSSNQVVFEVASFFNRTPLKECTALPKANSANRVSSTCVGAVSSDF